jgi:hypothetical protein
MLRRSAVVALALVAGALAAAADPVPAPLPPSAVTFTNPDATLGEVAAALAKASGVTVAVDPRLAKAKYGAAFTNTPFWEALEQAAKGTDAKIVVQEGGRKVSLEPRGASKEVSAAAGPFRVAVRAVNGRLILDSGTPFHEISLNVHWEPRYPVFRIDTHPKITQAKDDKGTNLIVDLASARHYPTGALTDMSVRLTGLTREAKRIAILAGEFRVTAAERMLAFKFDPTANLPVMVMQDRVTATLKAITRDDTTKTYDVELELLYPEGMPVFESFEEQKWLRDNRLQLLSPMGKPVESESEEVSANGRRVSATYRFKTDPRAKNWSLVYDTPSPLVEFAVPFKLQNIPIP